MSVVQRDRVGREVNSCGEDQESVGVVSKMVSEWKLVTLGRRGGTVQELHK